MRPKNLERLPVEYRELIEEYHSAIRDLLGDRLVSICIFGSVAKGEAKPGSDIDLLLIVEGLPQDVGLRVKETGDLHMRLGEGRGCKRLREQGRAATISEVILTPNEASLHPPILLDVVDEGIILYDKADFLKRVLDSIRRRLEKLGAKKVLTEKGHYWILKPDSEPGEVVEI